MPSLQDMAKRLVQLTLPDVTDWEGAKVYVTQEAIDEAEKALKEALARVIAGETVTIQVNGTNLSLGRNAPKQTC